MLKVEKLGNLFKKNKETVLQTKDKSFSGGNFLISRDDLYVNRTCIQLYNIHTNSTSILYVHETRMKCVHASVNATKTLLCFTIKTRKGETVQYSTFFVDHRKNYFEFSIKGEQFQHVQFIGTIFKKRRDEQLEYFLFFRQPSRLEIYSLNCKGGVYHHPESLFNLITNKNHTIIWYFWNEQENEIYFIFKKRKNQSNAILKIWNFKKTDNFRPKQKLKYVLNDFLINTSTTPSPSSRQNGLSNSIFELYEKNLKKIFWFYGYISPSENMNIQLLNLSNNGICICQQRFLMGLNHINFTIYSLHNNYKYNYNFNLNRLYKNNNQLFFTSCKNVIVVYLKKRFIQFIDFSEDHFPWVLFDGISGNVSDKGKTVKVPTENFDWNYFSNLSISNTNFSKHVIVDLKKGHFYNIKFDLIGIMDSIKIEKDWVDYFHLILTHYKKTEIEDKFVGESIRKLCSVNVSFRNYCFTEYLIGNAFIKMKNFLHQVDYKFLNAIVLSVKEKVNRNKNFKLIKRNNMLLKKRGSSFCKIRELKYFVLDRIKNTMNYDNFVLDGSYDKKKKWSKKSGGGSGGGSIFDIFKIFYSKKEEKNNSKNKIENLKTQKDTLRILSKKMFDKYYNHELNLVFPQIVSKEKEIISRNYTYLGSQSTNDLYAILKRIEYKNLKEKYNIFENLYLAIVETRFPPPQDFLVDFSLLGLEALSRKNFISYIKKDVFTVTEVLVEKVLKEGTFCDSFLLLLISKLNTSQKRKDKYNETLLKGSAVGKLHLLQHCHESIGVMDSSEILTRSMKHMEINRQENKFLKFSGDFDDDEKWEESFFEPLFFFVNTLKAGNKKHQKDLKFLKGNCEKVVSRFYDLDNVK